MNFWFRQFAMMTFDEKHCFSYLPITSCNDIFVVGFINFPCTVHSMWTWSVSCSPTILSSRLSVNNFCHKTTQNCKKSVNMSVLDCNANYPPAGGSSTVSILLTFYRSPGPEGVYCTNLHFYSQPSEKEPYSLAELVCGGDDGCW